jgi:hypothetical protein
MVHHYGGNKFSFKRQIDYLNDVGFDVFTFDLPTRTFGMRERWINAIAQVFDQVPEKKFVYSFSSPSMATLPAIANRGARDIAGWICDGGPFTHIVAGMSNLVHEGFFGGTPFKNATVQSYYSKILGPVIARLWGGPDFEERMREALLRLPKGFPIISFRATADKLVFPEMIDDFFKLAPGLSVLPVLLERSEHIAGFKDQSERYKTFLLDYFKRYATAL